MTKIENILERISRTLFDIQLIEKEKVSLMRKYMESANKELEYADIEEIKSDMITPPRDWICPRCHKKGFPSMWGIVCTSCANELRTPEYIKQAIEDGWLDPRARNNVISLL